MESVIEELGEFVISDVLQEAVDEVTGRSKRKWAIVLVAVRAASRQHVLTTGRRQHMLTAWRTRSNWQGARRARILPSACRR